MHAKKVLTIVMGVLIVAGTAVLGVMVARKLGGGPAAPPVAVTLDEPAGTRIAGIAAAGDRLAVRLQGGGPDRVLLIDPHTGAAAGSIALSR